MAIRVDPHGDALLAVDKDFDDAPVHEHPQFERLVRIDRDGRGFGGARKHVWSAGGIGRIDDDQALAAIGAKNPI